MDVSGEAADVMVKESMQITAESIKLLAAGSKNLAALLWALAQDNKKLVGKTNMGRLLREGKELKVFRIKESDLPEFQAFAQKNVLFAAVKDTRQTDGMIDLVTNVDFVSQVNLFMERRGYHIPKQSTKDNASKKAAPRAQRGSSSPQRGSGSRPTATSTRALTAEKPSVKNRLDALRAASESMKQSSPTRTPKRTATKKTR